MAKLRGFLSLSILGPSELQNKLELIFTLLKTLKSLLILDSDFEF